METALRDAAKAAEVDRSSLDGIGVGSPGTIDDAGNVTSARNLPDWEGTFPLAATLRRALGVGGISIRVGNDVQVATDAEFKLGAGRLYDSLLGVFWGTGVGGGLILDGKPWTGRGGAGEIGHVVVEIDGARCTCGRRGCMEAYAGRASMEAYVRKLHEEKGRKTDLFKLMGEHGRTRLTSGIWARALEHGDKLAIHIARPRGHGARRGHRIGRQRARRRGRDHRRRARDQARAPLRQAHRRGDAAAPVRRLATAPRARGRARRPRRRDRSFPTGPRRGVTLSAVCHNR